MWADPYKSYITPFCFPKGQKELNLESKVHMGCFNDRDELKSLELASGVSLIYTHRLERVLKDDYLLPYSTSVSADVLQLKRGVMRKVFKGGEWRLML